MKDANQQTVAAWRFYALMFLLLLLAVLLGWRVLSLQVLDSEKGYRFLQAQGDMRTLATVEIPAHRGMITDRNGQPLAVSTPLVTLWADPRILIQQTEQFPKLAKALGWKVAELEDRLQRYRHKGFMYLQRHAVPEQAAKVMALKIKGVNDRNEYRRFYPAGEITGHLVGLTNIDDRGQEGLELAYDEWLRGEPGSKRVLRDLKGRPIRDVNEGEPASPGRDLTLSIDLRLQTLAYRELKTAISNAGAKAGSVVVLDVQTGEVLAMVNQPSFNPNNRSQLKPAHLRNRAMTDLFEPGSTVKPFTMVAALESGKYQPDTPVDTNPGHLRVGSKTLVDPVNYGVLDVTSVLKKSSQVGTSKIALSLNPEDIWSVFSRLGLGRASGVGFPGEATGVLPNRPKWRPIEQANFGFGYGLSVTALQLAHAYAALGNEGKLRDLSLLKIEQPSSEQVAVAPEVAAQVVTMLEAVTEHGTGRAAQVDGYKVAGKTGTVHKSINGSYAKSNYRALFAGLAPSEQPRLAAVIMIDEPSPNRYYGGEVAAPVFGRIMAGAMRLLHVAPTEWQDAQSVARAGGVG